MIIGKHLLLGGIPSRVEFKSKNEVVAKFNDIMDNTFDIVCTIDWEKDEMKCKTLDGNEVFDEFTLNKEETFFAITRLLWASLNEK